MDRGPKVADVVCSNLISNESHEKTINNHDLRKNKHSESQEKHLTACQKCKIVKMLMLTQMKFLTTYF